MSTTTPPRTIEVQDFAGNVLARVPHDWTDQQIKDHVKKPKLNTKIVSWDEKQIMVGFVEPVFVKKDNKNNPRIGFSNCKFCHIVLEDEAWAMWTYEWEYVCPECKFAFESCFQQDLPERQDDIPCDVCYMYCGLEGEIYECYSFEHVDPYVIICKPCYNKYKPRIV